MIRIQQNTKQWFEILDLINFTEYLGKWNQNKAQKRHF